MAYFIDNIDFASATAVYLDSDLTIPAPDGFYSCCGISREVVGGVLLSSVYCPSCAGLSCAKPAIGYGPVGLYQVKIDATSFTGTGPRFIWFDPHSTRPAKCSLTYGGVIYNQYFSGVVGALSGVIGYNGGSCLTPPETITGAEFVYNQNTMGWDITANTASMTYVFNDLNLTAAPGKCLMILPDLNQTQDIIFVDIEAPCVADFSLDTTCVRGLSRLTNCSVVTTSAASACLEVTLNIDYNFVNLNPPTLADLSQQITVYAPVFMDLNAITPVSDGFFLFQEGAVFLVAEVVGGIVISINTCA